MKHEPIPADRTDQEDFDVPESALRRAHAAREFRRVRNALGLSQAEFARRFRVPVGTLRDWEQSRVSPPEYASAYMRLIGRDPELVESMFAAE
ncbi:MAG: helix-turn-helix domain-containing protein [Minwuia sp.]|nr:helix-turn-helix domain-containing protein [Minwuia sp.]